jgi:chromosome partitioning protein
MSKEAKCIAFANPKGGTGKTTSCINIAGSLVNKGNKVLIVDLDPRANATLSSGLQPGTVRKTMYDAILSYCGYDPVPITSIILETKVQNLHIAPSESDLSVAEVLMQKRAKKSFILKRMLECVKTQYDYILIDLPSTTGQLMFNGLCASDHVVVPLEPSIFSLDSFMIIKNMFGDTRKMTKCHIDNITVVLNRYVKPDLFSLLFRRQNASQEVEMKLKESNRDLFIVPEAHEIYEAQKRGLPISHYAPDSAVGKAYEKIADHIKINTTT